MGLHDVPYQGASLQLARSVSQSRDPRALTNCRSVSTYCVPGARAPRGGKSACLPVCELEHVLDG